MDLIICIVGESGSGKSTLAEALNNEGYNYIQSYTTRNPRYEGEKGHIFVTAEEYIKAQQNDEFGKKIIACTFFDGYTYWSTEEQYIGKGTSIYIVDSEGVKSLRKIVNNAEISVIYLKTEEKTRVNRMSLRKYKRINAEDEEIMNRIKHDKMAFSIVPCDYVVDADRPLEEVLFDVHKIIEKTF